MLGLAWKFIRFDRAKSIGIVTAIVISVFLIGQQLSLLFFLMGLMGNLIGNAPISDQDLWVIEAQSRNVNAINSFDSRTGKEIGSLAGIEQVNEVIITQAQASFLDGKTSPVTLVGAAAPRFIMGPVDARIDSGKLSNLMQPYNVSAEYFSARTWETMIYLGKPIELNGKAAKVNMVTKNAQAFGASLMYTDLANARYYGNMPPNKISLLVVRIAKGQDKELIKKEISTLFPHLKAWDAAKLKSSTVKEILISSNMGMSFGTLVVFAMISGFFIIGLTLYSSALDRIKDYGTLKAIGAKNRFVNRLIIAQSFLYALIGYVIAIIMIFGFKLGVAQSGMVIQISIPFLLFIFFITMLISVGGSLFAVRKIAKLEPASVF